MTSFYKVSAKTFIVEIIRFYSARHFTHWSATRETLRPLKLNAQAPRTMADRSV